ncbi:MAG: DUF2155 domain-containing protein [Holophaga sp.]|nr:DUF2155 domain-containing protein [Holophaga sp.]
MKNILKTTTLIASALLGFSACNKHDEKPLTLANAPKDATHQAAMGAGMGAGMGMAKPEKKESQVMVPGELKGKWKSIRIAVVDHGTKKETMVVVPAGADFQIPGTGLTIRAENMLPDFTMGGGVITSKSEKMENPAVQVRISEGGQERFRGWMFVKFPDTHAFDHPKYGLKLIEFIP